MRNIIFGVILVLLALPIPIALLYFRLESSSGAIGVLVGLLGGGAFQIFTGIRKLQASKEDRGVGPRVDEIDGSTQGGHA